MACSAVAHEMIAKPFWMKIRILLGFFGVPLSESYCCEMKHLELVVEPRLLKISYKPFKLLKICLKHFLLPVTKCISLFKENTYNPWGFLV